MKRLFILFAGLLALLWSCSSLQAQTTTNEHEDHASWFVGGVASFWVNSDAKTTSLEFHPELGYFINDTWAVGLMAGYGLKSYETASKKALQHEFSLSPFVRYYYLRRGPFNLYLILALDSLSLGTNRCSDSTTLTSGKGDGMLRLLRSLIDGLNLCIFVDHKLA